jgi:DEAD/DEAH box helicase domain-containing protein
MLHTGILPHHTRWARYFESLRYIVIDELHYYRGVYGSHLANLLRRLKRICEFYGSKPQFICCSATIANPRELAEALTGEAFELVERNGAPRGEKFFIFYNPPVVNRQLGIRRSYIHESRRVALEFIERNLQTLVFANNRLATEVLVTYLKDACDRGPAGGETVRGYRGGYLPRERREIERRLREGEIRAVVATNALELGIDIGSLDAVVMAGYPGTIASSWQRAGRAGRRKGTSAAVLVASSAPLDQYIVEHPDYFFGRSPEHAYINPENLEILLAHLKCAAFELPLRDGEKFGRHDIGEVCRFLEEAGFLHHSAGAWHWTSDSYPADATSLRSVASDNFVVVDITGEPNVIAEVSFSTALTTLHEKAIYLHEARQYHVERFDLRRAQGLREARRVGLLHRRHRLHAGEGARGVRGRSARGRAPGARRRAREPADCGLQEDQVLHHGKRGGREALDAGAGNAHHRLLAAFPGRVSGAFFAIHPRREAERHRGPGQCAAHGGGAAADVRSAGPGGGAERRHLRRPGDLRAQPVSLRYVSRRGGTERAALPPGAAAAEADGGAAGGVRCEAGCPSCVGPAGEVGERGKEVAG